MSYLGGITGGIGSGKTTVSNIFSHLGFKVYNSDERAKYLMQTNDKIIRKQVSITKGELEVLEDWVELPDNTYEDAIVNGIIRQIKPKKKEK